MLSFITCVAIGLAVILGFLLWRFNPLQTTEGSKDFKLFQRRYLIVYLLMSAADWAQGPYIYKLYSHYGYTIQENGILFVAGFGASLVFGTFVAGWSDRYGRKAGCVLYGVLYMMSCALKHSPNFQSLLLGRIFGGISTSLLFSVFESWMVTEHTQRDYPSQWMASTFSFMAVGNGLVAISTGWLTQWAVDITQHPVAPFDLSFAFLAIGTTLVVLWWGENFGDAEGGCCTISGFCSTLKLLVTEPKLLLVGLIQSLFEGTMFTFVFVWTPTLGLDLPHGTIFAVFMTGTSIGGIIYNIFSSNPKILRYVLLLAACTMFVPVVTSHSNTLFVAFVVFEGCVGAFFPSIGTLRSKVIPNDVRAAVMNIYRIPLNAMVSVLLLYIGDIDLATLYKILTAALLAAVFFHTLLLRRLEPKASESGRHNEQFAWTAAVSDAAGDGADDDDADGRTAQNSHEKAGSGKEGMASSSS
eukprot:m.29857 g.29857  ORF g.29857 m.29857 type:complete len:470 (-) comp9213_c1_seq3:433-1842(-)